MNLFELIKTSSFQRSIKLLQRIDFNNEIYYYGTDDDGNTGVFKIMGYEESQAENKEIENKWNKGTENKETENKEKINVRIKKK